MNLLERKQTQAFLNKYFSCSMNHIVAATVSTSSMKLLQRAVRDAADQTDLTDNSEL